MTTTTEEDPVADISRYPIMSHLRSSATMHVLHLDRGRLRHSGTGTSFWFRPLHAVLSEVPVDDRELPLLFHALTADFQDVTVQASLSYRVAEPDRAALRLDFSLDPGTGRWQGSPLDQIASLLVGTMQQHVLDLVARMPLAQALSEGIEQIRSTGAAALAGDSRLGETGIEVLGVRVVAVRPQPEVERALETPTRERIQTEADRAGYERRALAVERERTISENELTSRIELSRQEAELVAQRGANARREAEEQAAAQQVRVAAEGERPRALGQAEADAQTARLGAYADVPAEVLWALTAQEVAEHLPAVEHLVLTPELLSPVLARLAGRSA